MINIDSKWDTPSENPKLAWDDVHVWRVSLKDAAPFLQRLVPFLSRDEKDRAQRYRFFKDRYQFIVSRGLLKFILGSYLDMKPNKLRFSRGPYGKPLLADQPDGHALNFNVSHSHGLALFVVTQDRELGVERFGWRLKCWQWEPNLWNENKNSTIN